MKPANLLDYALGQLDDVEREAADREMAADPTLSARADRLGIALHRLLDDGGSIPVPSGLASRTAAFVADRTSRRAILDFVPSRVPFRWADVAVAAGVLLAGLVALVPAVNDGRGKAAQAACSFNLQHLGVGLFNYAAREAGAPALSYAQALKDENCLRDPGMLHCPCKGECPTTNGSQIDPRHVDYAYNVGHRPHDSASAEPVRLGLTSLMPLLADQPPHRDRAVLPGNSPNHNYRGQNVLFSDLHVEFFPTRRVKLDRDLYLNDHNQPEPGIGPLDSALVPAVF